MDHDTSDQKATTTFDTELRRHNEAFRRATAVQPADRVLDIGCGAGQTTRQAARAARSGSVLRVDVSAAAVEQATSLARSERLDNVIFTVADAQGYPFPEQHFDLAISRFGTMFFADPVAAFGNIRRALRPAGRLVMMVWQARQLNEWSVVIQESMGESGGAVPPGPDAFSLAGPDAVTDLLHRSGWADVTFTDVHEPVHYGADVDAALDWVRGFTGERLHQLGPVGATRAVERLRKEFAARLTSDGVRLDSRAWIVAATAG